MRHELSSKLTPVYRWVIPAVLTVGAIYAIWKLAIEGVEGRPVFLNVVLAVVSASVMVLYSRYLDKAKRVWLDDDLLIVNDYRQQAEIELSDIDSVSSTRLVWPTRINVKFNRPTVFGDKIAFFPRGQAAQAIHLLREHSDS